MIAGPEGAPPAGRKAVFLDRDGTLIEECGYLDRLDRLRVFPWTADALRLLRRAGFTTVVITNQSAIARGIIDETFLATVHREMDARLSPGGGVIDAYYFCPHLADAPKEQYRLACRCRKPGPGMIERACRDLQIDPARSFTIGDRWLDVRCGRAAGTGSVLVRSGHGADEAQTPPDDVRPDAILNNLMEAAGWILRNSSR
jgi:D-glycero-D-manno-heptose 1,7-bisphosphate phosphatase